MSLISTGFELVISLVDRYDNTSKKTFQLRADNYAVAKEDSQIIVEKITAISKLTISGYRISEVFINDSFSYPEPNVRAASRLQISCMVGPGNKKISIEIPGPVPDIFISLEGPGTKILNVSHELVVQYTDIFRAEGQAFIGKRKDLIGVNKGKKVSKKRT